MKTLSVGEIVQSLGAEEAAKVKRLLEQGIKIPPQPRVLEEFRQLVVRKEFDVRQIARLLSQDPGIVAMLFKVSASGAYRQHQPFESLEHIVHSLGVMQTFNLVLAIAVAGNAARSPNREALEAYWAKAQAIAQIAMLVANDRVTVCNIFPDQAYLAAIFQDCGVPILMDRFPTYCREMRLGARDAWVDLKEEDAKFNADHAVIGYISARYWNLPDFISEAIRFHHEPATQIDYPASSMVAILQLSSEIYYRDCRLENPEWETVKESVYQELGLSELELAEYADDLIDLYHAELDEAKAN